MAPRHAVLAVVMCLSAAGALAALQLPSNITAEATGPQGAEVTYFAGADGSGDDENGRPIDKATCTPASGSTFPLGTTTVQCMSSNEESGSFDVTVVDTRGPALHLPLNFSIVGSDNGATVTYSASAEDAVDGGVDVSCSPASGSFFPTGTTTVQCMASDTRQNQSAGSFAVTVLPPPPPPPPPPPQYNDITAEATGPAGAVVTFTSGGPGDQDDENGRPIGTCAPASGSTFPLGETTVQCSNGSFKVTVVDTTAPTLALPDDLTVQSPTVTYTASATDLVDGTVGVTCTPPSGSTFAAGTTTVHCSASDTRGNTATGTFQVTVEDAPPGDTEAPTITSLTASPNILSPPNGKLVEVIITASVHDNLDASPYVGVFDVTSNETITGEDWNVVSPLTIELRADRSAQDSGRVYTVWVEAIDAAGNRSVSSVTVTVPHDQGSSQPATAEPAKKWWGMRARD